MGILGAVLGHASAEDAGKVQEEIAPMLVNGEEVVRAYKLARDLIVMTNYRVILVDKQGVTGKKKSYETIPYKSISTFSVETAGTLIDMDADVLLHVRGRAQPVKLEMGKSVDLADFGRSLALYVLSA